MCGNFIVQKKLFLFSLLFHFLYFEIFTAGGRRRQQRSTTSNKLFVLYIYLFNSSLSELCFFSVLLYNIETIKTYQLMCCVLQNVYRRGPDATFPEKQLL